MKHSLYRAFGSMKGRALPLFALLTFIFTLFSGTALAASFPDIGVVGDHRMMTVVGFAQQSFYFDLFRNGQLQSLALLFALIGGLLILLLPRFQNFMVIASYLFLIFVLIIGPRPAEGSLFFYPLSDKHREWNCPQPASKATPMEVMCRMGTDTKSVAGTVHESLSAYAQEKGFGAFLPQLVTIHFFTAIERTLIIALWGDETRQLRMSDHQQGINSNNAVTTALQASPQLKYTTDIYAELCREFPEELSDDIWNLPESKIRAMAAKQFRFKDLVAANAVYYNNNFQQNERVYPALGATAKLTPKAYAKSLKDRSQRMKEISSGARNVEEIENDIDISASINAYINYIDKLNVVPDTEIQFPYTVGDGKRGPVSAIHDCPWYLPNNSPACRNKRNTRDPDPYQYEIIGTGDSRTVKEGQQAAAGFNQFLFGGVFTRENFTKNDLPTSLEQFLRGIPLATPENTSAEAALIDAMSDYPMQIFLPWYSLAAGTRVGNSLESNESEKARQCISEELGGGTARVNGFSIASTAVGPFTIYSDVSCSPYLGGDYNNGVQSCLDLAAMIQRRKTKVLEDAGIYGVGDKRVYLTDGYDHKDMQTVASPEFLKAHMGTEYQAVAEELQRAAKTDLMRMGLDENSDISGLVLMDGWFGTSFGKFAICEGEVTAGCNMLRNVKRQVKNATTVATGGPNNGMTGRAIYHNDGGFNAYSAAFGYGVIDIFIYIASMIQGFVFGVYMKLIPVFISYGLAIILFVTPFIFLMGLIVPAQAPMVIAAPIMGIAFLKTVSISLILVDHVFIYLMFWVDHIHLSDKDLYKSLLILMHLTASVMLFSIAGFLLFGLRDPGSFAKHLGSLDKTGQISWDEALKYGAAPAAVAKKALGMGKTAINKGVDVRDAHMERKGASMALQAQRGQLSEEGIKTLEAGLDNSTVGRRIANKITGASATAKGFETTMKESEHARRTIAEARRAGAYGAVAGMREEAEAFDATKTMGQRLIGQNLGRYNSTKSFKAGPRSPKGSHDVDPPAKELYNQMLGVSQRHGMGPAKETEILQESMNFIHSAGQQGIGKEVMAQGVSKRQKHAFSAVRADEARAMYTKLFGAEIAEKELAGKIKNVNGQDWFVMDMTSNTSDKKAKELLSKNLPAARE